MIVIGIDCGVTGAVAAIDSHGTSTLRDLPIVESAGLKTLDARGLLAMLREFVPAGESGLVVTEDIRVRAMAGRRMSHATETVIVGIRFAVEAVASMSRLDLRVVAPTAWKRHFGIKDDKTGAMARDIAGRLYPIQQQALKRVKDHNRAESLLIARYGQQEFA